MKKTHRGAITASVVVVLSLMVAGAVIVSFQEKEPEPLAPIPAPEINDSTALVGATVCVKEEVADLGSISVYYAEICGGNPITHTYVYAQSGLSAGDCGAQAFPECFFSDSAKSLDEVLLVSPKLKGEDLIRAKTIALWKNVEVVTLVDTGS